MANNLHFKYQLSVDDTKSKQSLDNFIKKHLGGKEGLHIPIVLDIKEMIGNVNLRDVQNALDAKLGSKNGTPTLKVKVGFDFHVDDQVIKNAQNALDQSSKKLKMNVDFEFSEATINKSLTTLAIFKGINSELEKIQKNMGGAFNTRLSVKVDTGAMESAQERVTQILKSMEGIDGKIVLSLEDQLYLQQEQLKLTKEMRSNKLDELEAAKKELELKKKLGGATSDVARQEAKELRQKIANLNEQLELNRKIIQSYHEQEQAATKAEKAERKLSESSVKVAENIEDLEKKKKQAQQKYSTAEAEAAKNVATLKATNEEIKTLEKKKALLEQIAKGEKPTVTVETKSNEADNKDTIKNIEKVTEATLKSNQKIAEQSRDIAKQQQDSAQKVVDANKQIVASNEEVAKSQAKAGEQQLKTEQEIQNAQQKTANKNAKSTKKTLEEKKRASEITKAINIDDMKTMSSNQQMNDYEIAKTSELAKQRGVLKYIKLEKQDIAEYTQEEIRNLQEYNKRLQEEYRQSLIGVGNNQNNKITRNSGAKLRKWGIKGDEDLERLEESQRESLNKMEQNDVFENIKRRYHRDLEHEIAYLQDKFGSIMAVSTEMQREVDAKHADHMQRIAAQQKARDMDEIKSHKLYKDAESYLEEGMFGFSIDELEATIEEYWKKLEYEDKEGLMNSFGDEEIEEFEERIKKLKAKSKNLTGAELEENNKHIREYEQQIDHWKKLHNTIYQLDMLLDKKSTKNTEAKQFTTDSTQAMKEYCDQVQRFQVANQSLFHATQSVRSEYGWLLSDMEKFRNSDDEEVWKNLSERMQVFQNQMGVTHEQLAEWIELDNKRKDEQIENERKVQQEREQTKLQLEQYEASLLEQMKTLDKSSRAYEMCETALTSYKNAMKKADSDLTLPLEKMERALNKLNEQYVSESYYNSITERMDMLDTEDDLYKQCEKAITEYLKEISKLTPQLDKVMPEMKKLIDLFDSIENGKDSQGTSGGGDKYYKLLEERKQAIISTSQEAQKLIKIMKELGHSGDDIQEALDAAYIGDDEDLDELEDLFKINARRLNSELSPIEDAYKEIQAMAREAVKAQQDQTQAVKETNEALKEQRKYVNERRNGVSYDIFDEDLGALNSTADTKHIFDSGILARLEAQLGTYIDPEGKMIPSYLDSDIKNVEDLVISYQKYHKDYKKLADLYPKLESAFKSNETDEFATIYNEITEIGNRIRTEVREVVDSLVSRKSSPYYDFSGTLEELAKEFDERWLFPFTEADEEAEKYRTTILGVANALRELEKTNSEAFAKASKQQELNYARETLKPTEKITDKEAKIYEQSVKERKQINEAYEISLQSAKLSNEETQKYMDSMRTRINQSKELEKKAANDSSLTEQSLELKEQINKELTKIIFTYEEAKIEADRQKDINRDFSIDRRVHDTGLDSFGAKILQKVFEKGIISDKEIKKIIEDSEFEELKYLNSKRKGIINKGKTTAYETDEEGKTFKTRYSKTDEYKQEMAEAEQKIADYKKELITIGRGFADSFKEISKIGLALSGGVASDAKVIKENTESTLSIKKEEANVQQQITEQAKAETQELDKQTKLTKQQIKDLKAKAKKGYEGIKDTRYEKMFNTMLDLDGMTEKTISKMNESQLLRYDEIMRHVYDYMNKVLLGDAESLKGKNPIEVQKIAKAQYGLVGKTQTKDLEQLNTITKQIMDKQEVNTNLVDTVIKRFENVKDETIQASVKILKEYSDMMKLSQDISNLIGHATSSLPEAEIEKKLDEARQISEDMENLIDSFIDDDGLPVKEILNVVEAIKKGTKLGGLSDLLGIDAELIHQQYLDVQKIAEAKQEELKAQKNIASVTKQMTADNGGQVKWTISIDHNGSETDIQRGAMVLQYATQMLEAQLGNIKAVAELDEIADNIMKRTFVSTEAMNDAFKIEGVTKGIGSTLETINATMASMGGAPIKLLGQGFEEVKEEAQQAKVEIQEVKQETETVVETKKEEAQVVEQVVEAKQDEAKATEEVVEAVKEEANVKEQLEKANNNSVDEVQERINALTKERKAIFKNSQEYQKLKQAMKKKGIDPDESVQIVEDIKKGVNLDKISKKFGVDYNKLNQELQPAIEATRLINDLRNRGTDALKEQEQIEKRITNEKQEQVKVEKQENKNTGTGKGKKSSGLTVAQIKDSIKEYQNVFKGLEYEKVLTDMLAKENMTAALSGKKKAELEKYLDICKQVAALSEEEARKAEQTLANKKAEEQAIKTQAEAKAKVVEEAKKEVKVEKENLKVKAQLNKYVRDEDGNLEAYDKKIHKAKDITDIDWALQVPHDNTTEGKELARKLLDKIVRSINNTGLFNHIPEMDFGGDKDNPLAESYVIPPNMKFALENMEEYERRLNGFLNTASAAAKEVLGIEENTTDNMKEQVSVAEEIKNIKQETIEEAKKQQVVETPPKNTDDPFAKEIRAIANDSLGKYAAIKGDDEYGTKKEEAMYEDLIIAMGKYEKTAEDVIAIDEELGNLLLTKVNTDKLFDVNIKEVEQTQTDLNEVIEQSVIKLRNLIEGSKEFATLGDYAKEDWEDILATMEDTQAEGSLEDWAKLSDTMINFASEWEILEEIFDKAQPVAQALRDAFGEATERTEDQAEALEEVNEIVETTTKQQIDKTDAINQQTEDIKEQVESQRELENISESNKNTIENTTNEIKEAKNEQEGILEDKKEIVNLQDKEVENAKNIAESYEESADAQNKVVEGTKEIAEVTEDRAEIVDKEKELAQQELDNVNKQLETAKETNRLAEERLKTNQEDMRVAQEHIKQCDAEIDRQNAIVKKLQETVDAFKARKLITDEEYKNAFAFIESAEKEVVALKEQLFLKEKEMQHIKESNKTTQEQVALVNQLQKEYNEINNQINIMEKSIVESTHALEEQAKTAKILANAPSQKREETATEDGLITIPRVGNTLQDRVALNKRSLELAVKQTIEGKELNDIQQQNLNQIYNMIDALSITVKNAKDLKTQMEVIKLVLKEFKMSLKDAGKSSSGDDDFDKMMKDMTKLAEIQEAVKRFQEEKNLAIDKLLASSHGGSVDKEGLANLKEMIKDLENVATSAENFKKATSDINLTMKKLEFNAKTTHQAEKQAEATIKNAEAVKKHTAYLQEQARQLKENQSLQKLMANTTEEIRAKFDALNFEVEEGTSTVKELNEQYKFFKQEVNGIKLEAMNNQLEKQKGIFGMLGDEIKQYVRMTFDVQDAIRYLSQGFTQAYEHVKTLDEAYTNMRSTMTLSKSEFDSMAETANDVAKANGVLTTDVLDMMKIYANANETADSINKKIAGTVAFQNVTGLGGEEATNALQTIEKQYQLTANGAMDYAEAIQYIGDVTTGVAYSMSKDEGLAIVDIVEGMEGAGAIMRNAGTSMEWYAAVVGTLSEQMNAAGSETANAMKMIVARTLQSKGAIEDLAESGEDMSAISEEASNAEKALASIGVKIREQGGNFRDFEDIIADVATKWDTLNDSEKQYVSEKLAGNNRRNYFITLMESYERVEELATSAYESEGTLMEANEIKAESLQGKLNTLTSTWQDLFQTVGNSDFFKSCIDGLTNVAEAAVTVAEALDGKLIPFLSIVSGLLISFNWGTIVKGFAAVATAIEGASYAAIGFQVAIGGLVALGIGTLASLVSSGMEMRAEFHNAAESAKALGDELNKIESIDSLIREYELLNQKLEDIEKNHGDTKGIIDEIQRVKNEIIAADSSYQSILEGHTEEYREQVGLLESLQGLEKHQAVQEQIDGLIDGLFVTAVGVNNNNKNESSRFDNEMAALSNTVDYYEDNLAEQERINKALADENLTLEEKKELKEELIDLQEKESNLETVIATALSRNIKRLEDLEGFNEIMDNADLYNSDKKGLEHIDINEETIALLDELKNKYGHLFGGVADDLEEGGENLEQSGENFANDVNNATDDINDAADNLANSTVEMSNKGIVDALETMRDMKELLQSINAEGLTLDNMSSVMTMFEDFTGDITDMQQVTDYINQQIAGMEQQTSQAYYNMNKHNQDYWNNVMQNSADWAIYEQAMADQVMETYGLLYSDIMGMDLDKTNYAMDLRDIDYANATTMAEAESILNANLVNQLMGYWASEVNSKAEGRTTDMQNVIKFLNTQGVKEAETVQDLAALWAEFYNAKHKAIQQELTQLSEVGAQIAKATSGIEVSGDSLEAYDAILDNPHLVHQLRKRTEELSSLSKVNTAFTNFFESVDAGFKGISGGLDQTKQNLGSLTKPSSLGGSGGSGGSGGRPSTGGSGRGSRPSTGGAGRYNDEAQKEAEKEVEDLELSLDRYYEYNDAIEDASRALDELRASGDYITSKSEMMKYHDTEITLINEKIKAYEALLWEQNRALSEERDLLTSYGFTIDDKGNITNYMELLKSMENYTNSLKGDEKEAQKEFVQSVVDLVDKYTDLSNNAIPNTTMSIIELKNEITDSAKAYEEAMEYLNSLGDAFYSLNDAVEDAGNALEKYRATVNKDDIKTIEELNKYHGDEVVLINNKIKAYENLLKQQKASAEQIRQDLILQGFYSDAELGNIWNYDEKLRELQVYADTLTGEARDAQLEFIDSLIEMVDEYTELSNSSIPDTEMSIIELKNEIKDSNKELEEAREQVELTSYEFSILANALERVETELGVVESLQEHAVGSAYVELLNQEIALLEEKHKLIAAQSTEYQKQAKEIKEALMEEGGIEFDENGTITNAEVLRLNYAEKANSLTGEAKEEVVEEYEKLLEKMDEYNELVFQTMPGLTQEWYEHFAKVEELDRQKYEAITDIEKDITSAIEHELDKRREKMEESLDKQLEDLKEKMQKEKELYDKQYEEEDWNNQLSQEQRKLDEIKQQMVNLSRDTSLSGKSKLEQLKQEYQEQLDSMNTLIREHEKELADERYSEEIEALEKETEEKLKGIEETFSEENVAELVNQALVSGFVTLGDEVVELNGLMTTWLDETGDGLYAIGDYLKTDLIESLQTVRALMSDVGLTNATISPNLSSLPSSSINTGTLSGNNAVNINFGAPLLNIEGNVTEDVMSQVEAMVKQSQKNVVNEISKALNIK